jgi:NADH:ubiquinone oxidoreductase subunit 5 (subunit L)/multisubunit Na+/H+ antiporter MnhA subunit
MEYLLIDNLSMIMTGYIGILSIFILLYARKNFEREVKGNKWFIWFVLSIASVLLLILSGNVLFILLGFILIGIFLNQLLLSYPGRDRSQVLARKKFLVSRLGDFFFILAIYFYYQSFDTFNINEAHAKLASLSIDQRESLILLPGLFLAFAALIKSAQFPFHFWLPETIEAPTPVSALMHAGIINAGGYLLVRLDFLFISSNTTIAIIFISGFITIFIGGFSMLSQVDVKRKLAYSTVGQMGFMMVEFALGLHSLVILHIMGHGFYKAYGFLTSGNREIAAPYSLMSIRIRIVFGFLTLIAPLSIYFSTANMKYSMLSLLSLIMLGFTPKRKWLFTIATTILLVTSNFILIDVGNWLLGSGMQAITNSKMIDYSTIGLLSLFGGFVLLLPLLKKISLLQSLYCYSQRGFMSEYYTDKLIKGTK